MDGEAQPGGKGPAPATRCSPRELKAHEWEEKDLLEGKRGTKRGHVKEIYEETKTKPVLGKIWGMRQSEKKCLPNAQGKRKQNSQRQRKKINIVQSWGQPKQGSSDERGGKTKSKYTRGRLSR